MVDVLHPSLVGTGGVRPPFAEAIVGARDLRFCLGGGAGDFGENAVLIDVAGEVALGQER